jgi:superfamily II DNA/RNA helicase
MSSPFITSSQKKTNPEASTSTSPTPETAPAKKPSPIITPRATPLPVPAAAEAKPKATAPGSVEPAHEKPPVEPVHLEAEPTLGWLDLGLRTEFTDQLLKAGYKDPTLVQQKAIPRALKGEDLVVSAQTGTGKTLAFALPLLERVFGRQGTCALVLAPTREIALQTQKTLTDLGTPFGIRSVALIGGTPLRIDEAELKQYPQILVSTPGRICDHLERGNIWLEYLDVVVLDEADRMLEMGFADQLSRILRDTPETRQTMLFSATFSPTIEKLSQNILYKPFRIQVGKTTQSAAKTVDQQFVFLREEDKIRELQYLVHEEKGTIFIFARSKDSTAKLWRTLRNNGFHEATQLHSGLTQAAREQALQDFKDKRYRVLIGTDVVGRGIHVDDVAHVINFDCPRDADDYIHRIGRTGRANSLGKATTFITQRDEPTLSKIEAVIGRVKRPDHAPKPSASRSNHRR